MFLAGFHTSASTIAWIFIELTRYPDVQAKLRRALHSAYSAAHAERRAPSNAELNKIRVPYLDAVLEEVLRLHATLVSREAMRDTQLMGYHIPKGTMLLVMANGPGFHSPSLPAAAALRGPAGEKGSGWDESGDMSAFDPERWLRKKEGASEDEAFEFNANAAPLNSFGLGVRGCWGKKMAYMQLRLIVALVVWHFDLQPVPTALENPTATMSIIHRADQCWLRLKSRDDTHHE